MDPTAGVPAEACSARARQGQERIVFAEGEEPRVIRAAYAFQRRAWARRSSSGREAGAREAGGRGHRPTRRASIEIVNAAQLAGTSTAITTFLYERLQREGFDRATCSG